MTILDIALCGMLAVSSAGLSYFRKITPPRDDNPIVLEQVADPVALESKIVVAHKPIQTLEQRDNIMFFESDALYNTPFDQAIVMPYE